MKTEERRRARELRAQGWSVKEIERELGVSRSSVSLWVRDVELGPEQLRRLMARTPEARLKAAAGRARAARERRRGHQQDGRRLTRRRGASYAAGCMLYWAEGAKGRNSVQMSNSDPDLLVFFADFLRQHFDVPDSAFSVYCNLFADHIERQREIERFWLRVLRLPEKSLRKSIVNTYSKYSQKKRANKLPYGTCRLAVHR
jgi:transcriptional regulator with XRE-family HTH domain